MIFFYNYFSHGPVQIKYCQERQKDWMNMKTKEKLKHVGGKQAYHLDDAFDNLTETLTLADSDNCPNVEKLTYQACDIIWVDRSRSIYSSICRLKSYRKAMRSVESIEGY